MYKNYTKWIVIFLLPSFVLFCIVYLASLITMAGSSFTGWRIMSGADFVGLENYLKIFFHDRTFHKALVNTVIWVILQSTVHVAVGVTFALILAKKEFYWKFARTVYFIPNVISGAALGMLYLNMFNPQYGPVNALIRTMGIKDFDRNWFFDYHTAFFTVTMTWLPFAAVVSILCLAEIFSIPESILESARMDGAGDFKTNIHILLPMLRNIIGTCVVISAASMLKAFETIFMTTNGGPGNETVNLPLYLYKTAMLENQYGYANALGMIVTLMGIGVIIVIQKGFKMGESDV